MRPFIIFSLPRSRSAWLSAFLSDPDQLVAHDLAIRCKNPAGFLTALDKEYIGTCETGAAFAAPLIRQYLPSARFVVVNRDISEVVRSLHKLGFGDQTDEMIKRSQDMLAISDMPETMTINYNSLNIFDVCNGLHDFCKQSSISRAWFDKMASLNIQVNIENVKSELASNAGDIADLKATIRGQLNES